jgi:hypothetical protein
MDPSPERECPIGNALALVPGPLARLEDLSCSLCDHPRWEEDSTRTRNGRELWAFLRPRLRMLVRMQTQWGDVHKLYKSNPHPPRSGSGPAHNCTLT